MITTSLTLTCHSVATSWPVMIDGNYVASMVSGQTLELPVAPGSHILQLGAGWLKSPEVSFTVASGEQARYRLRYRYLYRSSPSLLGLLFSVFSHDSWIVVESEDSYAPPPPRPDAIRDPAIGADNYARALGAICRNCGQPIEAGQAARRRGEAGWAHDVCPLEPA